MTAIKKEQQLKKPKLRLSMTTRHAMKGYMFILPWLIGFIYFYVRCLFLTTEFSLSSMTVKSTGGYELSWVGLKNFIDAFTSHASFKQVLTTSVWDMMIDVPLIIFFSLFVSMLLNRKFKGRGLVRAIFFLPIILNADAVTDAMAMAARMMNGGLTAVSSEMAAAATSNSTVGIGYYVALFGELALPTSVLEYIVGAVDRISSIIQSSGVQIILFIAALQSIPGSLYEVARIEGATGYETFWKVTFPMVMPHIITNTIYTIVDHFSRSDVVELAYNTAFSEYNYGLSSAFSLISTLVTLLILGIVVWLLSKRTFYYN